jgi:hypothetical protein
MGHPSAHGWLADDNDDMMMAARIIKQQTIAHQERL